MVSIWTDTVNVNPMYHFVRQRTSELLKPEINRRLMNSGYPVIPSQSVNADVMRYQKLYPYAPALFALAAVLENNYSIGCIALDAEKEKRNHSNWLEETALEMSFCTNLAVFISFVTPETDRMLDFCHRIKKHNSEVIIVVGGVHATYYSADLMKSDCIDFVIIGEGEETVTELMNAIKSKQNYASIRGLAYRENGEVLFSKPRNQMTCIENLPIPAYHFIDSYTAKRILFTPTFSRGCPLGCDYCAESHFWNKTLRHKDPIRFVDELELLNKKYNQSVIHIADSTFGLDIDKLDRLCTELEKRKLDCLFSINARPDLFTYLNEKRVARLMKLNFFEIYIGAESASQEVINTLHRVQTNDILLNTLSKLKQMEFPIVKLYLMIGAPGDNHTSMQLTMKLVRKLLENDLILYATTRFFVPTPGTPLFDCDKFNTSRWSEYDRYNFPPLYNVSELSDIELDCYLIMLQNLQMNYYLNQMPTHIRKEHRSALADYVNSTYQKQTYF